MINPRVLAGGRYKLDRKLGSGGMADVWLAHDNKLNRSVAVKLLALDRMRNSRRRDALTEQMHARYEKEWQSMARIRSPYVAAIHDRGQEGDQVYFVMEWIDGQSLDHYVGPGNVLTLPQVTRWSVQICEGLADAHDVDVVHRDIKPANIVINENGNARIVDFGLARLLDVTETHGAGATWRYIAPERCNGEPGTHLSDLYSLGCVMYEMLAGNPPFTSRNGDSVAIITMHLRQQPVDLGRVRRGVPAVLGDLVMSLLAKEPGQRPQHARAVARTIRRSVEHRPERPAVGSEVATPSTTPAATTDPLERVHAQEQRVRELLSVHPGDHPAVVDARFRLAELTGDAGDPRGAADLYEAVGTDCAEFYGPYHSRVLDAYDHMARWIAAPS
ncbi:serine/threonine-protein kinase [Streptomyces microflavus]|uniref:serine/threonine-protein kinase n=1 Tax=Streptomyces microflavus TaxID=1919 RepID=UPI0037FD0F44